MSDLISNISAEAIKSAAYGFSEMINRKIQVSRPMASMIPVLKIPNIASGPDDDAVGVYLRFRGDMFGQIMLIIPSEKAFNVVDLLMGQPEGTTQQLGSLERSALGELANLCGSFFLNSLSNSIGDADFRPSPPAVMVDMVGAILDIVIATIGNINEEVWVMEANFFDETRRVEADFWVIPDLKMLQPLLKDRVEK